MDRGDLLSRRLGDLAEQDVRDEVARILRSRCFAGAPSLSRLLAHVVDLTLAGHGDELKEYSLGVDVFARGEDFDPKVDTIVRVQARRLRAKLDDYYASEGIADEVVIGLAKGRYVPEFTRRSPPPPTTSPAAVDRPDAGRVSKGLYVFFGMALVALLALFSGLTRRGSADRGPVTDPSEYVQLTNFNDSATAPALSPDGRMVTFIRGGEAFLGRGQIYVKVLPDGEAVPLTTGASFRFAPVFSPDGSRVAYSEVADGGWQTFTVPVLGGQRSRLLPNASGLVWIDRDRVMFSEFPGQGPHLAIVTSTEARADKRTIYLPEHERGMAHYSYPSPDRTSVLIVEMDRTGTFRSCRLVPFDGNSPGHLVGPEGRCRAAAWSPDGRWMYFAAEVAGQSHLWRQAYPNGMPEQITFGPTEEEGVAVAPDGRSLLTAIGTRRSAIWIHDSDGERPLSTEGFASSPQLSADGRRVYYLLRTSPDAASSELHSIDLATGRVERLLPGMLVAENDIHGSDYQVSADEREVVFASRDAGGSTIWLAPLDRRTPPTPIARDGALVSFGPDGSIYFVTLGQETSSFTRIGKDGSGRTQVSNVSPIVNRSGISPDGAWAILFSPLAGGTAAVPTRGGHPRRICDRLCWAWWSPDGRWFYVQIYDERTLAIPLASGVVLPALPESPLDEVTDFSAMPGTRVIERGDAVPGLDPSTYVFAKTEFHRNLYRVPLH